MDKELRVPPGVTLKFERLAAEICEEAKLDYHQWVAKVWQFTDELENCWREGIESGLSTDDAERIAIEKFGKRQVVARHSRKILLLRFLTFQRYSSLRYILYLCSSMFSAAVSYLENIRNNEVLIFGYSNSIYRMIASFLLGAAAIGGLFLVKWNPEIKIKILDKLIFVTKWIVSAPIVFFGVCHPLATVVVYLPRELRVFASDITPVTGFSLMLALASSCFAIFGILGFLAELIGIPNRIAEEQRQKLIEAQKK